MSEMVIRVTVVPMSSLFTARIDGTGYVGVGNTIVDAIDAMWQDILRKTMFRAEQAEPR